MPRNPFDAFRRVQQLHVLLMMLVTLVFAPREAVAQTDPKDMNGLLDFYTSTGGASWDYASMLDCLDASKYGLSGFDSTGSNLRHWNLAKSGGNYVEDACYDTCSLGSGTITGTPFAGLVCACSKSCVCLVTKMALPCGHLSGTIPEKMGVLASLSYLDLSHNSLSGTIPDIFDQDSRSAGGFDPLEYSFQVLHTINLGFNLLTGTLPSLGSTTLRNFQANNNKLSGAFPDPSLYPSYSSISLLLFDVAHNQLLGTVPASFGTKNWELRSLLLNNNKLSGPFVVDGASFDYYYLQVIDLSQNAFTGQFPADLFSLRAIDIISAGSNCFSGSAFTESVCDDIRLYGQLSTLAISGLGSGQLCASKSYSTVGIGGYSQDGPFKRQAFPPCLLWNEYGNSLRRVYASGNAFTGELKPMTVPATVPIGLSGRLVEVDLSRNRLSGTISGDFVKLFNRVVFNDDNAEVDINSPTYWEDKYKHANLSSLLLSHNQITGGLSALSTLDKGIVGTSQITLDLSENRMSGNIPETINVQQHLSLLSGNYFECVSDGKDLPTHDPAHSTYMCMNNSNPVFPYILYAGIIILFSFAVKGRAGYSYYYHTMKMWLKVADNPEVLDDVHHPYVKRYSNYHQTTRSIVLKVGLVLTIGMVIAYSILSGEQVRSVSNMKAGWATTAAHLTGMGPTGLLLFVGLSLMILTWYFLVAHRLPIQLTSLVQVSLNMMTCQKETQVKAVTDGVAEPVVETHCIFSYDVGKGVGDEYRDFVLKVNGELKKLGAQTWVDEEHLVGDRREQVMAGIEHTQVAIVFITASYRDKVNQSDDKDICKYEFANAVEHIGPSYMIPVVIDPSMRNPRDWKGELGAALGRQLYVDLTDHSEANLQARANDIFVGLNEMVANKTGSPIIVQTQYIRGMLRLLALMILIWGVMIVGNITYVHVYLEHPHMFELYGILFAAFNLFWTMCVTPLLFNSEILRFGAKERLQSAFVQSKVQLKLTFNAISAILIPLVCIIVMSPKCFKESIVAGTSVTQEFSLYFGDVAHPGADSLSPCLMYNEDTLVEECLIKGNRKFSTTFNDPFVYNATCATEILKSYAPLYQFMFILLLLRSALQLRYLIWDIDQAESGIPVLGGSSACNTCWMRFVEAILRLPSTHLMKSSSQRKSMHSTESVFSTVRKDWIMDGIASTLSHMLILFTFGAFVPLLCLLATAAIALDSLVAELVFGRFLSTELGVVLDSRRDVEANTFESDKQAAVAFSDEKRAYLQQDITDVHEDWGALLALQDVDLTCQKCLPLSTVSLAQHHLMLVPAFFFGLQLTDIISRDYSSQFWPFYVMVGLTLLFEVHVLFVFPKLLKKHGEDDSAYRIKVEVVLKPQPKSSAISRKVVPTLSEPPPDTHCFLTHDWGKGSENHRFVSIINSGLKKLGALTWFDEEQMKGNVRTKMVEGIEHTKVVIVFVTPNYRDKVNQTDDRDNCRYEFTYAVEQIGPNYMIPVVVDKSMINPRDWKGELGAALARQAFVDLTDHSEENVAVKVKEIFSILNEMIEFKTGSPIIPIEVLNDAAPIMLKDIPKSE